MVSINYATREVTCKIVFYGPGLSGKTTNLQYIHEKVPSNTKGKMISLATEADRTLYFDFLPINIGSISGFDAKFQLYTVPGQVYYNATRKLVLRGTDGLVFVADSQADKMDENIESINNMKENLAEYGYNIDDLPIVIQYNKRDLPNILSIEELQQRLNDHDWPHFGGCAVSGEGVFDTLKLIIKMVLDKAQKSQPSKPKKKEEKQPVAAAVGDSSVEAVGQSSPSKASPSAPVDNKKPETVRENAYDAPDDTTRSPSASVYEQSELAETSGIVRNSDECVAPAAPTVPAPQTKATSGPGDTDRLDVEETRWEENVDNDDDRPFPGSTASIESGGRKISVSDFQSPDDENSAENIQEVEADLSEVESGTSTIKMEPLSRVKKKKRGFFKRLFGIK